MNFTKHTALGLLAGLFLCLGASEIFCRVAAWDGFWYHHWNFTGDLTSLPEIRDRFHSVSQEPQKIYLLGDSVLGPTALREHRVASPRTQSLAAFLQLSAPSKGWKVLSLGADGLLLPDLEGLGKEIQDQPPQKVLLVLNMRMFAPEYEAGPKALSRTFFLADLSPETAATLQIEKPADFGTKVAEAAENHWAFFRACQLLKTLWYFPSQKDFFQSLLENLLHRAEDEDLKAAALKMKIASFYETHAWKASSAPLQSLERLLTRLTQSGIPVVIVFTPQNLDFVSDVLDRKGFDQNRKFLAAFLKNKKFKGIHYEDWSTLFPSDLFLDHCHLTPAGNQKLALRLADLLERKNL